MSRIVRQSQLRNLVVEPYPSERWFTELGGCGDVASGGNLVSASSRFVAFVHATGGNSSVAAVSVERAGKQRGVSSRSCQTGGIYDLAFCARDDALLASGSGGGSVALWRCSDSDADSAPSLESVGVLDDGRGERVVSVNWNPSVAHLVASAGGEEARLWDASAGASKPLLTCALGAKGGAGAMDLCWDGVGALLCALNADKSLSLHDPRSAEAAASVANTHGGPKALGRVASGGCAGHGELEGYLYTTGFTANRERELAVWDVRKLEGGAVSRLKTGGSGSGVAIPLVVPDTKILMLVTKGETVVKAFEPSNASPFIFALNQTSTGSSSLLGAALLPVQACDYMSCEVSRLFKLTRDAIEVLRVEIPRKLKQSFHDDIFPPTTDWGDRSKAVPLKKWQAGEAPGKPPMVAVPQLAQRLRGGRGASSSGAASDSAAGEGGFGSGAAEDNGSGNGGAAPSGGSSSAPSAGQSSPRTAARNGKAAAVVSGRPLEAAAAAPAAAPAFEPSAMDNLMSRKMGYVPKFKYAKSSAVKKDLTIYNLKTSLTPALAVSARRYAVTWQGGGGPVFVGELAGVGKMDAPEAAPVLNGHSRPVLSLDFSPFDDGVLATGGDDCVVRAWRLGAGERPDEYTPSASSVAMSGHQSAVRLLRFHPTAANLLASGAPDGTLRLWDVQAAEQAAAPLEYGSSADPLVAMDWDYRGALVATMSRACAVRALDPRAAGAKSKLPGAVLALDKAHAGSKPASLAWLGDSPYLLTSGCSRMGAREIAVWDARKAGAAAEPLSRTALGAGATSFEPLFVEDNGAVLLVARGENTVHLYELEGLSRCATRPENAGAENPPAFPHACQPYLCPGETTSAVALLPRRALDTLANEVARVIRLTPTYIEPLAFTVPRSQELQGYFADDLYCDTRAARSTASVEQWLDGATPDPALESMEELWQKARLANGDGAGKRLSQRDPAQAHAALKRAQDNTARFRREREEEEARLKAQQESLARMQRLAEQHEEYNPNLSMGGRGHDDARQGKPVPKSDDVADDEWD